MSLRRRQREAYERTLIDWLAGMLKPQVKAKVPQPRPIRKQVVINKPPKRTAQANLQLEVLTAQPIRLRPYQIDALNEFLKNRKGVLTMASVTGDTMVFVKRGDKYWYGPIAELEDCKEPIFVMSVEISGVRKHKTARIVWKEAELIPHYVEKDLYEITLIGARRIKVTGDHSLFTRATDYACSDRELKPIEARLIKPKTAIAIPTKLPLNIEDNPEFDDDFLVFCGLWLADGYYTGGNQVGICVGDDPELEDYVKTFSRKIGCHYWRYERHPQDVEIRICSVELVNKMKSLGFVGTADTKRVPKWVFTELSNRQLALFLRGYFSGDGYPTPPKRKYCKGRRQSAHVEASSCNRALLEDIQTLLLRLGILSTISSAKKAGKKAYKPGAIYYVLVSSQCDLFYRKVGFIQRSKMKKLRAEALEKEKRRRKELPDIIFRPVKQVKYLGVFKGKVYDFHVPGTENFIANNILAHNTATGKTFVALEAIRRIKPPVAIIVPTIPIMQTVWLRRLKQAGWSEADIGLYYGEKKELKPILITTYHSASRHPEILSRYPFLIFDEVHHLAAPTWSKLLEIASKAKYSLGLTATLSKWNPDNWKIIKVMPIIYSFQIPEARKGGWVAPIEVYSAPAEMSYAEAYEYEKYQEIIRKVTFELGTPNPTEWSKLAKQGNRIARKGLWALTRRKMLLSSIEDKKRVVLEIVRQVPPNKKVLLFSESIRAIEDLRRYLTANGYKCLVYHSEMKKKEREYVLRKQWGEEGYNILLSCRALDEGLDVPEASVGIIHCSGRTPRQIVQRLGRLIRKMPGKIAKVYVVWAAGTVENRVLSAVKRAVWKVR